MELTAAGIDAAYLAYLEAAHGQVLEARQASSPPCLTPWPADPPGPGYVGTRCTRFEGHQDLGLTHGLRIHGQLLEWH